MEDYEYFHVLDERGDNDWVSEITRTVAPKTFDWEHDWRALLDWRRKVAEKILGILDEFAPDPPSDLSADPEFESVRLFWTPPGDEDLAGYDIRYAVYEGDDFVGGSVGAGETSALVTNLKPGREVSFWITAYDTNGNRSEASEIVSAMPLAGDDDADDRLGSPNVVRVAGNQSGASSGDDADQDSNAASPDESATDEGACGC
jgi:hypothetical protein